ncbi:MAG: hypothetical protein ACFFEV_03260 [Candidatus Thorarchaeota archaeon]
MDEKWFSLDLLILQNVKRFEGNLDNEGNNLLPFEVELEIYQLNDITRNLLVLTLLSFAMYYGWTKSANDETWIERKFASFFTLTILAWYSLFIIIPFSVASVLHPDLILEIGERILSDSALAIVLVFFVVIVTQVLNYKEYFRKRD